eukprot:CAMPEP_0201279586 /NCGR_PEP_ID=MMETSP0853-20130426/60742_1 /ASSEMBLY_ACC=CAM_ASM_000640 /TAXON_ID=183588 /ORGANISM="Pseudo-nitzschia fraudulenta, Strain WWA7" /LENGTH=403 /DNA_ID=CAMNT_0047587977 /DNA_START=104 /DNA_END=1315 /DNA_ORIENTATION=+
MILLRSAATAVALALIAAGNISAFSGGERTRRRTSPPTPVPLELLSGAGNGGASKGDNDDPRAQSAVPGNTRRRILSDVVTTTIAASGLAALSALSPAWAAATAAAENQRCDASDPRCGADGILREIAPKGDPIPRVTNRITHVVQLVIDVGERREEPILRVTNRITHVVQLVIDVGERREEVGFLRFGLYGEDCPRTVRTMLEFLTPIGITGAVTDKDAMENTIGMQTSPVSILQGGIVPAICPGKAIELGVPSQKKAFARSRGLRAAGDNFVPENRPEAVGLDAEPSARKHDAAGLISLPEKGIGYASTSGDVDAAYSSAFLVTADGDSSDHLDGKLRRRVVGQVIDDESMEFLARLASLPIQKKGPGGKGPPLLKVTVLDVGVQKVGASNNQKGKAKKSK